MTESKAQQWSDAKSAILTALDIRAECQRLGVRFTKDKPTAKGYLDCHALDRDDLHASAAVNVGDGPARGVYTDRGGGRACGFFDIAVRMNRLPDFKTSLLHYAQQTGVKLPGEPEERDVDKAEFFPITPGALMLYAAGKPGVTAAGMLATGAVGARTPKRLPPEKTNHLIVVPVFGPGLLDLEPIGYHGCPMNPKAKYRLYQGEGKECKLIKVYTIGEASGVMGLDCLRRWDEIKVVNWLEGLSDLWAMQSAIIADGRRDHGCLSLAGASIRLNPEYLHHFANREHRIWGDVGDKDGAGDTFGACLGTVLTPLGSVVRNIKLPAGADGTMDVRKFLAEA